MVKAVRLSADERRLAIVHAVKKVFAKNGFHGTTTRELADAAGVSEALLYKHFPSKESLFAAMLDASARGATFAEFNRILSLEPCTETIIMMVHFMVSHYAQRRSADADSSAMNLLQVRSLLEDGEFVRLRHERFASAWIRKFEECLECAASAGDLTENPVRYDLRVWFVQHMAFSLMLNLNPKVPAVDYKIDREALIEQATRFALLGVGLKEKVIRRYCSREALVRLARKNNLNLSEAHSQSYE